MLRTRGQQRATVKEGGWAELPDELVEKVLAKVLELLQAGGLSFLSGLRHGAAGVRCMEGRARCDGEAAGAEMADHRRDHGHAGAAVSGGGVGGGQVDSDRERVVGREHAGSEQPACAHVSRHHRLRQLPR